MGFPGGSDGKESSEMQETWVQILSQEDSLGKGMATHSSIFAWRIPWTEEPGGLQSMGSLIWTQMKQLMHACIYFYVYVFGG